VDELHSIADVVGDRDDIGADTEDLVALGHELGKGRDEAGVINLTRYLAAHYGGTGVRVNVVSPGGIYNPERPQKPEFLQRYAPMTMLGRMANSEEIGGAVVFLLSDASTYITGINLPVDGGYTAK